MGSRFSLIMWEGRVMTMSVKSLPVGRALNPGLRLSWESPDSDGGYGPAGEAGQ